MEPLPPQEAEASKSQFSEGQPGPCGTKYATGRSDNPQAGRFPPRSLRWFTPSALMTKTVSGELQPTVGSQTSPPKIWTKAMFVPSGDHAGSKPKAETTG